MKPRLATLTLFLISLVSFPGTSRAECVPGVLTTCTENNFRSYVADILRELFPFAMLAALIMIVFSGLQYMSSGLSPDGAKQAKQRITTILTGVVFFYLIKVILDQVMPGLSTGG